MFLSSYRNTSGGLGEREMLWEHEPQASVSTAFSSSPKPSRVFLFRYQVFLFCFDTSVSSSHSILQFLSLQYLLQEKKKGSAKFLKRIQKQAFSSLPREKLKHFRKLKKIKKKTLKASAQPYHLGRYQTSMTCFPPHGLLTSWLILLASSRTRSKIFCVFPK